jgi:hypothetical protein
LYVSSRRPVAVAGLVHEDVDRLVFDRDASDLLEAERFVEGDRAVDVGDAVAGVDEWHGPKSTRPERPVLCEHRAMADRSRPAFGLVVALAALGISSCGGTSRQTPSVTVSSATSTPAQFIARAAAVCRGVRAQEEPLKVREESLKKLPEIVAGREFVSLAGKAAAISRAADERLRALPRPPADAQAIQRLLQAYSEEATDATAIASAAIRQESGPGEAAAGALARSIALHRAPAKSLGMGGCFAFE